MPWGRHREIDHESRGWRKSFLFFLEYIRSLIIPLFLLLFISSFPSLPTSNRVWMCSSFTYSNLRIESICLPRQYLGCGKLFAWYICTMSKNNRKKAAKRKSFYPPRRIIIKIFAPESRLKAESAQSLFLDQNLSVESLIHVDGIREGVEYLKSPEYRIYSTCFLCWSFFITISRTLWYLISEFPYISSLHSSSHIACRYAREMEEHRLFTLSTFRI